MFQPVRHIDSSIKREYNNLSERKLSFRSIELFALYYGDSPGEVEEDEKQE